MAAAFRAAARLARRREEGQHRRRMHCASDPRRPQRQKKKPPTHLPVADNVCVILLKPYKIQAKQDSLHLPHEFVLVRQRNSAREERAATHLKAGADCFPLRLTSHELILAGAHPALIPWERVTRGISDPPEVFSPKGRLRTLWSSSRRAHDARGGPVSNAQPTKKERGARANGGWTAGGAGAKALRLGVRGAYCRQRCLSPSFSVVCVNRLGGERPPTDEHPSGQSRLPDFCSCPKTARPRLQY